MKPLGRRHFQGGKSKHHVRINGEYHAWLLDVCTPNKKADRQSAQTEIRNGEIDYKYRDQT